MVILFVGIGCLVKSKQPMPGSRNHFRASPRIVHDGLKYAPDYLRITIMSKLPYKKSTKNSKKDLLELSELELDAIFDGLGKPENTKGSPRAPRGAPKETVTQRAPRTPTAKGPTVIPKELEGLGLEALLDELEFALDANKPQKYPKNKFKTVTVKGKQWWVPERNSQLLAVQIDLPEEYQQAIRWKMESLAEEWGLERAVMSANNYLKQDGALELPPVDDEELLVQLVLENNSRIMEMINAGDPEVAKPASHKEALISVEDQMLNWEDFLT